VRTHALALPAVLLLLAGCTSIAPFVVSGKSLSALGNQFADTGAAMNKALDAGKVTPEQYRVWSSFAKRFQAIYPLAVDGWKTSVELNDKVLASQFSEAVAQLAGELASFYVQLKEAHLLPLPALTEGATDAGS
jgi:hypothetical protein